jgi:hypothetical protein
MNMSYEELSVDKLNTTVEEMIVSELIGQLGTHNEDRSTIAWRKQQRMPDRPRPVLNLVGYLESLRTEMDNSLRDVKVSYEMFEEHLISMETTMDFIVEILDKQSFLTRFIISPEEIAKMISSIKGQLKVIIQDVNTSPLVHGRLSADTRASFEFRLQGLKFTVTRLVSTFVDT